MDYGRIKDEDIKYLQKVTSEMEALCYHFDLYTRRIDSLLQRVMRNSY